MTIQLHDFRRHIEQPPPSFSHLPPRSILIYIIYASSASDEVVDVSGHGGEHFA